MENQLFSSLQQAQISRIKHRPLKPSNLFKCRSKSPRSSQLKSCQLKSQIRMLENKQQRRLIDAEKQLHTTQLREKRKSKEFRVMRQVESKYAHNSNQLEPYRASVTQQRSRQKDTREKQLNKLLQKEINDRIDQGRKKAQVLRTATSHNLRCKIETQMQKNKERLAQMQRRNLQENDKHHMKQWNSYERKLIEKYNKENQQPMENKLIPRKTNQLYIRHQVKQKNVDRIIQTLEKTDNEETEPKQNIRSLKRKTSYGNVEDKAPLRVKKIKNSKSQDNIPTQNMAYFGLKHEFKDPEGLINKLQGFIMDNCSAKKLQEDRELLLKLQKRLQTL